jgi:hypothetical protein
MVFDGLVYAGAPGDAARGFRAQQAALPDFPMTKSNSFSSKLEPRYFCTRRLRCTTWFTEPFLTKNFKSTAREALPNRCVES